MAEEETREDRFLRGRTRRLTKEADIMSCDPPIGCHAEPTTEDYLNWEANILGPEDTPYEDGIFYLKIEIPKEYPFKPPMVRFTTRIYHANFREDEKVNIPLLTDSWQPAKKIPDILKIIRGLLIDPGSADSSQSILVTSDACRLYIDDKIKYNQIAREWTLKYAMNSC